MKRLISAALLCLAVAACDSAEERAEKHYQTAVELLAEGDVDRALVELRNVFQLDGRHREARLLYADTMREQGNLRGAYRQYLRVAEQYPDDLEATRALADLALESGNAAEARRYADAGLALVPDDTLLGAIDSALDFNAAVEAGDEAARAEAVTRARALLEKDPALYAARRVVVAQLLSESDWTGALAAIDGGLEVNPQERALHGLRIGVLDQLGDKAALEAQLVRMTEVFPEDETMGATLVRWYVSEDRLDEAEAWLRGRIREGADDPEPRMTLVRFLSELRGPGAALAELEQILSADPAPADVAAHRKQFRALRAGFLFTTGARDRAMTELEETLEGAEPSEETDGIKVALARMRASTGNQVGARALIEEVLEHDPGQVGALKLKAGWLIDDDKTGDAIVALRAALGTAPRDADIMTLLARAYEREGNRELMAEMLSLAVEASNRAPEESLRYARFLIQDENWRSAEDVLIEALRLAPTNVAILAALGQAHLGMEDWPRAEQDIARLRELDTAQSRAAADELQAQIFARQRKSDDLMTFLEDRATSGAAGQGGEAAVIRAHILNGQIEAALARSAALLEQNPEDLAARFIHASVQFLAGQTEEAETALRALIADEPRLEPAWTTLYAVLMQRGETEAAGTVLSEAEAALPDSLNLKWVRAGHLERLGDTEGAIALYEALYAENSNVAVIANNLASLLTTARDDPESLERAFTIARRLRNSEVPAFQDTYGWIAFRQGELDEALAHLEPAAAALGSDPLVLYHLGRVYAALGRADDARAQYAQARERLNASRRDYGTLRTEIAAALEALDNGAGAEN